MATMQIHTHFGILRDSDKLTNDGHNICQHVSFGHFIQTSLAGTNIY